MSHKNGIVRNVFYNIIIQLIAVLAPLITAPYVSRVFNANIIGSYSFALANSSYFVLAECLGLSLYGQLQISSIRDNRDKASILFFELLFLKVILMLFVGIFYMVFIFKNMTGVDFKLSLIMFLNIIANGIDITWALNGFEEFRTVAIRSLFVRVICVSMIMLFVKTERDLFLYAIIMQGSTLIGALAVYPSMKGKVVWPSFSELNVFKHMKPAASYFVPGLVTTIFSSTDKTMLGLITDAFEVGIYEQAYKISQICLSTIAAVANAIFPRATYLYQKDPNNKESANQLFYLSYKIVISISVPVAFGIAAIADEFVPIFFGKGYEDSVIVLLILCLNVLIIAVTNICGQQLLIARSKQREYNVAVLISAIINVILNIILIYFYQSVGAAIASVISSVITFVLVLAYSRNEINLSEMSHGIWKSFLAAFIMFTVVFIIKNFHAENLIYMSIDIFIGILVYFSFLYVFRDGIFIDLINKYKK